jgi:hypothetical protein
LTADIRAVFSGHGLESGSRDVGPRKEIVDLAVGVAVDDPGEHVGEIAERLDVVELAGLDQRNDDGPVLGAAVTSGEEGVLAVECDRTDRGPLPDAPSAGARVFRPRSATRVGCVCRFHERGRDVV